MNSAAALAFAVVPAAVPISVHAGAQSQMIFASVWVDGNNQMLLPAVRVTPPLFGGFSHSIHQLASTES